MTRKRWRLVSDDESGDVFSAAVGVPVTDAVRFDFVDRTITRQSLPIALQGADGTWQPGEMWIDLPDNDGDDAA